MIVAFQIDCPARHCCASQSGPQERAGACLGDQASLELSANVLSAKQKTDDCDLLTQQYERFFKVAYNPPVRESRAKKKELEIPIPVVSSASLVTICSFIISSSIRSYSIYRDTTTKNAV